MPRRTAAVFACAFATATTVVLSVSGCTAPGNRAARGATTQRYTGPTEPLDAVLARINAANAKVRTLRATGYWEGELGAKRGDLHSINGQITLLHTKPDKVRLFLDKDVAGNQFDMGTDGRRFWVVLGREAGDTCYFGTVRPTGEAPSKALPIRPELLLDVIGVATYPADLLAEPVPTVRFNPDYDAYMLTWSARDGGQWRTLREVWYDRATLHPRYVFLFDPLGRPVVRARLSGFAPVEMRSASDPAGDVARVFDILFPETDSHMTIKLDAVRDRGGRPLAPNAYTYNFDPAKTGAGKVIDLDARGGAEPGAAVSSGVAAALGGRLAFHMRECRIGHRSGPTRFKKSQQG